MKKIVLLLSLITLSTSKNIKYCDIKGNIKNPGVYEIKDNNTIKDIIDIAGGLKSNSYTDNINLSKKVTDEMVIYINSKQEINNIKKLKNCECSPIYTYIECDSKEETKIKETESFITATTTTTTILTTKSINSYDQTTTKVTEEPIIENNVININVATKEELVNIKGLGESKAENIIEYRKTNGNFKTIEDIMNVKGIGQKLFDTIKEYIKV